MSDLDEIDKYLLEMQDQDFFSNLVGFLDLRNSVALTNKVIQQAEELEMLIKTDFAGTILFSREVVNFNILTLTQSTSSSIYGNSKEWRYQFRIDLHTGNVIVMDLSDHWDQPNPIRPSYLLSIKHGLKVLKNSNELIDFFSGLKHV